MGGVDGVVAIGATRHDDVHRRLVGLHVAGLHRRRVRAQQHLVLGSSVVEVHRVRLEPAGMVRRRVERVEVVPGELGLRSVGHLVAEPHEDVGHLVHHLLHEMERAAGEQFVVDGHVEALGRDAPLLLFGFQLGPAGGTGLSDGSGHLVDEPAGLRPRLVRKGAERASCGDHCAVASRGRFERGPQLVEALRGLEGGHGLAADRSQTLVERRLGCVVRCVHDSPGAD